MLDASLPLPEKKSTKRVDPVVEPPVHPEYIRGNIPKEDGWIYQRVHVDSVDGARLPMMLEPSKVMFGGWEVVLEPEGLESFRRADDGAPKDRVARDMDTIWMRCRIEEYERLVKNKHMKEEAAAARIGAGERDATETTKFTTSVKTP